MDYPLVLVDGSSYFFRAFHALPPLTNSKGQPTGAIYGVVNMVKRLLKDYNPEKFAVVFDAKGKTFRDDMYPEYKANRPPMPTELSSQFKPLIEILEAMGLPVIIVEGVEADDVIGTLCEKAWDKKMPVLVSTGDKDMAQLVNSHITLINTMSNKIMNVEGVKEKFGVTPSQIIDYLALVGDTSDNIPGVNKCGPKTAVKWLTEYETLDNIIANAKQISGKIGDNLREAVPNLPLSKRLVTIKKDVELPITLEELTPSEENKGKLISFIKELEFKSWLKELLGDDGNDTATTQQNSYQTITDKDSLAKLLEKLQKQNEFCLDTETTSLDVMQAELVGISIAYLSNEAYYIPLAHTEDTQQLDLHYVIKELKPILENAQIKKIGQNIKYDINVLRGYGITLTNVAFDTMIESYVLNSTATRHDMDSLSLKYLGHKTISYKDVAGSGAKQLRFDEVPVNKAAEYAAEDADITLKLHKKLYPMLDDKLLSVFTEIDMPLVNVLAAMEYEGVLIDKDALATHGTKLKKELVKLEEKAYELASEKFNLNSTKQLREILYNKLNLPVLAKTPKGQPSTAESVLQDLAFEYELPSVIITYRGIAKLVSTYIEALPKRINAKTNRVHTSYNQAVTATGRLSSSEPNLQNIPIRNEQGRLIRKAFIAPQGKVLLAADYSQIELRIMAHLSKDEGLLNAFAKGLDIHKATASEIFSVKLDEVTNEQRRRAKAVNFGLIYGMSHFGLAKQLGVSREDAQEYIDIYFSRYPGVKKYMDETRDKAHKLGFVETINGRRLYLPEINAQNKIRQKAAERTAINAPMQGTAADIIKKAMIAVAKWQKGLKNNEAKMIMQVHDELIFEINENAVDDLKQQIKKIMETTTEISVPLIVDVGVGNNWDEAH